ncbi:alpha/beta fold hydrolase [Kineococcus gynurae]|uniref:Alpha/beta fold hydrolase n=1 Tax=Kineococcus gynurae TaxID=452979 RepID=A0ABV5LNZ0_9ACTN
MDSPVRVTARVEDGSTVVGERARSDAPGTPLLLLPGQSLGPDVFTGFADLLDRGTFVVATRGTEGSARARESAWTTELFAADAVAVLDAAGIARCDVLGFSMGGRVAQQLAARHPDRVRRLVLAATGPGGRAEVARPAEVDAMLPTAVAEEDDAARRALAELFFTPAFVAAHPDVAARFRPQGTPRSRRRHHAASRRHDAADLLPRIQAPTLVLHGLEDRLTPPGNADVLARAIPDADVHLLPGARHGCLHEPAGPALAAVTAFLGRDG